jgi:hypothetical protein
MPASNEGREPADGALRPDHAGPAADRPIPPVRPDVRGRREARPEWEHREVGPIWEGLVDRQIRAAMAEGSFDDLPFQGERIPIDDSGGEWALAFHILKQAGITPEWITIDKEIRELLEKRNALLTRARRQGPPVRERDRQELTALVEKANGLVRRLEIQAPTYRQQRPCLDLDIELAALAAAVPGGVEPGV